MKILVRPKNRYGWARVLAWTALAIVAVWTLAAAGLRAAGGLPWMAWSGYHTFSLLKGVEFALVLLLAAILAGWLEKQERRRHKDLSHHREAERIRAEQREAAVRRFHAAVVDMLPVHEQDRFNITPEVRIKITQMTREAMQELDGNGKGDLLQFLYEHKLVTGEKPVVDLHGIDFRGVILTNATLPGICLEGLDLSKARMNGVHLEQARLAGVNLGRAFLRQADLRGAILSGSNLREARLEGANLEGATCSLESLNRAILIDTIDPEGRKVTNELGKQYLRDKELSMVVDRL